MKILVTGGRGLLARHVVEEMGAVALGRDALDITRADHVARALDSAEVVINCAAYTNVDGAESEAEEAFAANVTGAANLARAARERGALLVHLSTDFVFDGTKDSPYDERDRPNPQSAYARSKYEGERAVLEMGGRASVVRVQGLYGEGGRNFSSKLRELIVAHKPLKLDRERRVQPTWARAAARQLKRLVEAQATGIFHVSCKGAATWAQFAQHVAARLGVEPNWEEVATAALAAPAARPTNCLFAHVALAERGLDVMPDWRHALDEYLDEQVKESR
jgi:dTDP-4-dehydrorhamnose reductase